MDLRCTRCGEPWELDYVLHDEPEGFQRKGGLITHCPCCPEGEPDLTEKEQDDLAAIRELAALAGDDVDGLAADLEDFGLV